MMTLQRYDYFTNLQTIFAPKIIIYLPNNHHFTFVVRLVYTIDTKVSADYVFCPSHNQANSNSNTRSRCAELEGAALFIRGKRPSP